VDNPTSVGLKAAGLPVAEYDGGVNFWMRSVEDFVAVRIISFRLIPTTEAGWTSTGANGIIGHSR
jgi:hypothetical protein